MRPPRILPGVALAALAVCVPALAAPRKPAPPAPATAPATEPAQSGTVAPEAPASDATQGQAPAVDPATGAAATPGGEASAPTGDAAPPPPPPSATLMRESVTATINDEIVSTYDLRQRVRLLIVSTGVQPTQQNLPSIEREALRALIDERLQAQELRRVEEKQRAHVFPSEKEVDAEIEDMAKSFNVKGPQLIKTLEGAGIEPATLRNQLRVQLGWRKYVGGRFHDNVRVGDSQIDTMLARMNAAAAKSQYLVSEVFLDNTRVGGPEQAVQGAQSLLAQVRQGAPFAAVARQFSSLPTAANGGDAGWLVAGEMPAEIQNAVEGLQVGQVSEPVVVSNGVYLVQLREKRSGSTAAMVSLKQAAIALPADATPAQLEVAQTKLVALRGEVKSCDALAPAAAKIPGVVAGDLGETNVSDLNADFRKAIEGLKPGEVSEPVRTPQGLHLVELCGRHVGGAKEPTRADVENRIYGEQLGMIARRFLRDLRNSAAIENR